MSVAPPAASLNDTPLVAEPNMSYMDEPMESIDPALSQSEPNASYADEPNASYMDEPMESGDPSLSGTSQPNMSYADESNMSYMDEPLQSVDPSLSGTSQPNMSYPNQPQPWEVQGSRNGSRVESRLAQGGQPGQRGTTDNQDSARQGGQAAPARSGTLPASGVPLTQAVRMPRSGAATADPEKADLIDQIAALAPLNIPVIIPLAPAALPNVFEPPASLNTSDLKVAQPPAAVPAPKAANGAQPPAADAKTVAEQRRTLARIANRYAETRRTAEMHHQSLIQQGDDSVRNLVNSYEQIALQIPGSLIRADSQLQSSFDAASSQVITAADDADQEIVRQFNQAKRVLGKAFGAGLKAVNDNANSAAQQITTILNDLSKGYREILEQASLECELKSVAAYDTIEKWKLGFNTNYPIRLSFGKAGAIAEAWQKAVHPPDGKPGLADQVMSNLSAQTYDIQSAFSETSHQVETNISNSVKPSLQQHADRIGTDGVKNVTDAHTSALNALRKQTRAARDAVANMRKNALAQLDARRKTVRMSLEVEAQQAMAAVRIEASTAVESVSTSLVQSLPYYSISIERYHTMLTDANAMPTESLGATADAAAPTVIASLADARTIQTDQLETVTASVQRSQERRFADLNASFALKGFDATNQIQATAFETTDTINKTAETMTAGFSAIANGVNAAAQAWAAPLSKVFADFIKEHQTELDKNKKGFKKEIDGDKDKGKQAFLDWVSKRAEPEIFFEKDLDKAWEKVYTDLSKRLVNLSGALDAGIINKIDEGGVTGALRGLTAAQGYAMRYEWEIEQNNGSLELTLLYALNRGTDDYNAAINYLNGNTAAGARFELEASMHWYNDEEDRIKAVMRSLTPEQLAEMHQLAEWKETEEDVRSALDETDLDINVFDALNAGNHFLAAAYEKKDAIDKARESGSEDALNEQIASFSHVPAPEAFGGREVTPDEYRAEVEREFAHVQGQFLNESGQPLTQDQAADVVLNYATRPIERVQSSGGMGGEMAGGFDNYYTETVGERQTALASALLHHGEGSVEARAAQVVVEIERPGGAKILNLDNALHDARLDPNNTSVNPQERNQALADREQVLHAAAESYSNSSIAADNSAEAKAVVIRGLSKGYDPELGTHALSRSPRARSPSHARHRRRCDGIRHGRRRHKRTVALPLHRAHEPR